MTKWEFALCDCGWWLVISDLEHLVEYHEQMDGNYVAHFVLANRPKDKRDEAISQVAELRQTSLFKAAAQISASVFQSQLDALFRGEKVYINQAGGWNNCMHPEYLFTADRLLWPNCQFKDIRVEQWDEGYHWYAYVGNVQVKDGDIVKWATEDEARTAALHYLRIDTVTMA